MRRCTLSGAEGEADAMLLDLSLRGVYVSTPRLPLVGDEITIAFRVPGNARRLEIVGIVAWVQAHQTHPVHGLPPGFGARFKKLAVEDVRVIARAIQSYCLSNPIYRQYL